MGDARTNAARATRSPTRRALVLLAWLAGLSLFAWYAHARLVTPPAAQARSGKSAPEPGAFFSPALASALESPALVGLPGGAAFSAAWVTGAVQLGAIEGIWNPARFPAQQALVARLSQSTTPAALDAVVGRTAEWFESGEFRAAGAIPASCAPVITRASGVARTLTERSRYRAEVKRDLAGAVDDLQAALRLAGALDIRLKYYGASLLEVPMYELNCRLQETALPAELAQRLIRTLRDELGMRLADQFGPKGLGPTDATVNELLDRHYTDDGNGNGWLVLSSAPVLGMGYGGEGPRPDAVWNIFAPLYRSRAEMRVRLANVRAAFEKFEGEPALRMKDLVTRALHPEPRDGPLIDAIAVNEISDFARAIETIIRRRAAVVMLALTAYHGAHGRYPARLEDLVPEFLTEVPLDAYTAKPFVYRPGGDRYDLRPANALTPEVLPYTWALVQFGYRADTYLIQREKKPK